MKIINMSNFTESSCFIASSPGWAWEYWRTHFHCKSLPNKTKRQVKTWLDEKSGGKSSNCDFVHPGRMLMPSLGGGKLVSGEAPIGKPAVAGCGYMELEAEAIFCFLRRWLIITDPSTSGWSWPHGGRIVCLSSLPTDPHCSIQSITGRLIPALFMMQQHHATSQDMTWQDF